MNYVETRFRNLNEETKEVLIALLAETGYDGFEENDSELLAYIPETDFDNTLPLNLAKQFNVACSYQRVEDRNWNSAWESNFEPITIGDFCLVRADFHLPSDTAEYEVVITPKMSFGTGHHATTYMMLQQMKDIVFAGTRVLDFGTGTGILAILAEKLGAAKITAIDNDPTSIRNAAENIERNECRNIELVLADTANTDDRYQVILANITRNVIVANSACLMSSLETKGILLISGLLHEDEQLVLDKAAGYPLTLVQTVQRDKWLRMKFQQTHE